MGMISNNQFYVEHVSHHPALPFGFPSDGGYVFFLRSKTFRRLFQHENSKVPNQLIEMAEMAVLMID